MTRIISSGRIRGYFLAAAMLFCGGSCLGQDAAPEYKFKAAYLYHFAQFVEWPPGAFANPKAPLVIAVLGQSPFGDELDRLFHGKTLNGHPLAVRTIHSAAEARTNCHVLFISSSEKGRLPELIGALRGASVLTVGENDGFTETGGMIRFVLVDKKIKFQINDDAAKAAGLTVPAKLLSLAQKS
jgi:hypothetical protein